jgi:hypothetical protein
MRPTHPGLTLILLGAGAGAISCGSSQSPTCGANPAAYAPAVDPAQFSTTIDNKWLFFPTGAVFNYMQTSGDLVEQDVTSTTRVIMGVTTLAVHDFLKSAAGDLLEDTYDYFAQDAAGNVWYFGEDTKAYSGTTVSTAGTWYAGVDCAKPGIVMEASPRLGDSYRQEYLPGEAEDQADVSSLTETVSVPYGTFTDCVMTTEHTDLAPGDVGTVDAGKFEDLTMVNGRTMP